MKTLTVKPQTLYYLIVSVAVIWFFLTVAIEISLGWPGSAAAIGRRLIGWAVYFMVFRALWRARQNRVTMGAPRKTRE